MTPQKSFSLKHAAVMACFVLCSILPGLAQSRMTELSRAPSQRLSRSLLLAGWRGILVQSLA